MVKVKKHKRKSIIVPVERMKAAVLYHNVVGSIDTANKTMKNIVDDFYSGDYNKAIVKLAMLETLIPNTRQQLLLLREET